MKKVLLLVRHRHEMLDFQHALENFFMGMVRIEAICEETDLPGILYNTDVLLSYRDMIEHPICERIHYESYVPLQVTLKRETRDNLMAIAPDECCLLMEDDPDCAQQITDLIHRLFRQDLKILPFCPDRPMQMVQTGIAFRGDTWYPATMILSMPNVLLLDRKEIELATLLEIIHCLNLNESLFRGKVLEHSRRTIPAVNSFDSILKEHLKLEKRMSLIFEHMTDGVITFCRHGIIFDCSAKVEKILDMKREELLQLNVTKLLPLTLDEIVDGDVTEKLIEFRDHNYIMTIIPAEVETGRYGLLLLNNFDSEQQRIARHRKTIVQKQNCVKYDLDDLVGSSHSIEVCKRMALQIAKSDASVLITGESGTGKELFAHIIHRYSSRRNGPFVAVNCAAFSESLLESELFGYESGAFTGALKGGKPGLFETAHCGTVFLDEIGEMPYQLQSRLLRVLQEREVIRVGSHSTIGIDVRIIAATNQDLPKAIAEGRFRQDLYFRLNVLPLHIPSLKERREDIPELFDFFTREKHTTFRFSQDLLNFFSTYSWPGNVRELRNFIELFSVLDKPLITLEDVPYLCVQTEEAPTPADLDVDREDQELREALSVLLNCYRTGQHIGRAEFARQMSRRGCPMGEQQARGLLKKMEADGLVTILKGRGGTALTKKGLSYCGKLSLGK